jgi:MFS transporter, OPA family, sugar phosphate sensor protein UhpC
VLVLRCFAPGADAPPIKDPAEVDRRFRRLRLSVMTSLTLGYGLAYTCRLGLSIVKKPLIDGGIFDAAELGWIGSAFFYGYGFGKLFNGFVADHTNVRRFIPFGLAVSAVANLAFGFNSLALVATVLWALNGWFQGILAPASVVSLTQWFSGRERGRGYGIWNAAHSIGEGITFAGTAVLVGATLWRSAFWAPGALCLGAAIALAFTLRDRPETCGLPPVSKWKQDLGEPPPRGAISLEEEEDDDGAKGRAQIRLLRLPAVWICGLASALMYMTRYAVNSWGVLYLQEHHGFALEKAGAILAVNTVAGIFGSFAYGYISDRFFDARRPPVTLIFGFLQVVALFIIFYGPRGDLTSLFLGYALYGFTLSGILAVLGGLFAVDMEPKAAGAAMGIVGCFSYIGAGVQEVVSGTLIEAGMTLVDGEPVYDFSLPILVWIGASILSMLLAASLWGVKTKG